MEVKLKFQDKFYDMIDHNKCPTSEKSAEKCILRNSYFHHSEPNHIYLIHVTRLAVCEAAMLELVAVASPPRAAEKEGTLLPKVQNRTKIVIRHKTI